MASMAGHVQAHRWPGSAGEVRLEAVVPANGRSTSIPGVGDFNHLDTRVTITGLEDPPSRLVVADTTIDLSPVGRMILAPKDQEGNFTFTVEGTGIDGITRVEGFPDEDTALAGDDARGTNRHRLIVVNADENLRDAFGELTMQAALEKHSPRLLETTGGPHSRSVAILQQAVAAKFPDKERWKGFFLTNFLMTFCGPELGELANTFPAIDVVVNEPLPCDLRFSTDEQSLEFQYFFPGTVVAHGILAPVTPIKSRLFLRNIPVGSLTLRPNVYPDGPEIFGASWGMFNKIWRETDTLEFSKEDFPLGTRERDLPGWAKLVEAGFPESSISRIMNEGFSYARWVWGGRQTIEL